MPERFLGVENATVAYGHGGARCQALSNLSLSFEESRLTLVMGPSGSGKTTLLSVLGCLLSADQGSVYVRGVEVNRLSEGRRTEVRRRHIGFIFQAFRLFRSLSALDNVKLAQEIEGRSGGTEMADKLLLELGLEHKLHLKPDALSGGEKQRVAIARALVGNPSILLADEPTAALDSRAGQHICEILAGLVEDQKRTVIVVSHDPRWEKYSHRTVLLRDGQLVQSRDARGIGEPTKN